MLNFTEAYRTAMYDDHQIHRLTGTVNGIAFGDEDVKDASWAGVCSNQSTVLIGSAAISSLKLTFLKPLLTQGEWEEKPIVIYDGTMVGGTEESPIFEDKLVGTFYISEAVWTNVGTIEVTAYDCLSKMDGDVQFEQTTGFLYDHMKLISMETGVPLGMSQSECEALPNGTALISICSENDIKTYRDYLSKLAQLVGGFGYAKRDGSFAVKPFNNTSLLTIPINRRQRNAKYSDYQTRFDYLSYVDQAEGETIFIGDRNGYGMDIGSNPFLQYGVAEVRSAMANAIFAVVQQMTYTPYNVSVLPAFCVLELGDVVTFSDDYNGNSSSGAIMSMTWSYSNNNKSVKVQCFGANPNLKKAKTATDNAINGIKSSRSSELVIHTYKNAEEIILNNGRTKNVVDISFATTKSTIVTMNHEVILDVESISDPSGKATVTAYYYINDELEGFTPVDTIGETGKHIIPLIYFLDNLSGGMAYEWRVELKVDGGSASIDRGDVHAWLKGQGLVPLGEFDGTISCDDEITPMVFDRQVADFIDEVLDLDISNIGVDLSISDIVDMAGLGNKNIVPMQSEDCSVELAKISYAICSNNGEFAVCTADGHFTISN